MGEWSYLYTYLQSNLLELPIFFYFYRKCLNGAWYKPLLVTSFSNSITHPLVFFGFMASGMTYLVSVLLAEAFTVMAEMLMHWYFGKLPLDQAFHASLLSNFFSWQVAPVVTFLLFWV